MVDAHEIAEVVVDVIKKDLRSFYEELQGVFREELRVAFRQQMLRGSATALPTTAAAAAAAAAAANDRPHNNNSNDLMAVDTRQTQLTMPPSVPVPPATAPAGGVRGFGLANPRASFVPLLSFSTARYAQMFWEDDCEPDTATEVLPVAFRKREAFVRSSTLSRGSVASRLSSNSRASAGPPGATTNRTWQSTKQRKTSHLPKQEHPLGSVVRMTRSSSEGGMQAVVGLDDSSGASTSNGKNRHQHEKGENARSPTNSTSPSSAKNRDPPAHQAAALSMPNDDDPTSPHQVPTSEVPSPTNNSRNGQDLSPSGRVPNSIGKATAATAAAAAARAAAATAAAAAAAAAEASSSSSEEKEEARRAKAKAEGGGDGGVGECHVVQIPSSMPWSTSASGSTGSPNLPSNAVIRAGDQAEDGTIHPTKVASRSPHKVHPDKDPQFENHRSDMGEGCNTPSVMKRASLISDADYAHNRSSRQSRAIDEMKSIVRTRSPWPGLRSESFLWLSADRLMRSAEFEAFTMLMICLSAVLVGVQTWSMAYDMTVEDSTFFRASDTGFCLFFCFELALRLYVQRSAFFRVWGWGWNVFDAMLVATQVLEEVLVFWGSRSVTASLSGFNSSFLLRAARMLRAVRAVRVLHVMRFAEELRLLVGCVVFSMRAFWWAFVFLSMIVYVASLSLSQLVLVYRAENGPDDSGTVELTKLYGTLPQAWLSIFEGLTGGLDWHELVDPLIVHLSPVLGVVFCLYMAFALLAVLNVVSATFVEGVIQRAARVKEIQKMRDAGRLFKHLDLDNSGFISYDEISDHLESPEVESFFRSIDVDTTHAHSLFNLLDVNGTGVIEFQEFLSGCIRLQGPAKTADIAMAMRDLHCLVTRLLPPVPEDLCHAAHRDQVFL